MFYRIPMYFCCCLRYDIIYLLVFMYNSCVVLSTWAPLVCYVSFSSEPANCLLDKPDKDRASTQNEVKHRNRTAHVGAKQFSTGKHAGIANSETSPCRTTLLQKQVKKLDQFSK